MQTIQEVLGEIRAMLACLVQREQVKEWYTTAEVAAILRRAEYSVREWCRQHRATATKQPGRRGRWLISHQELVRLRNEGLLPASGKR